MMVLLFEMLFLVLLDMAVASWSGLKEVRVGKQSEDLSLLRLFDGGRCGHYARSLDAEGGAYLMAGVLPLFSVVGLEYLHNEWKNLFWSTVTQQNASMVRTCAVTFPRLALAWSFVTS